MYKLTGDFTNKYFNYADPTFIDVFKILSSTAVPDTM
jgi:hypothetical protein